MHDIYNHILNRNKFFCQICFIIVIIPISIYSQTNSSCFDYYPIQLGDKWQYKQSTISYEYLPAETLQTNYFFQEISIDTIMPNGKNYFGPFFNPEYGNVFRRVDSTDFIVYEYDNLNDSCGFETILYDLSIIDSAEWLDGRHHYHQIYTFPDSQNVGLLDVMSIIREYNRDIMLFQELAKGFGISSIAYGGSMVNTHNILTWARIGGKEYGNITYIENKDAIPTSSFELRPNYPNPFNSETSIEFSIPATENIQITIYNILGDKIKNIINEKMAKGVHIIKWNANNYSSGVYFIKLSFRNHSITQKCLLIK